MSSGLPPLPFGAVPIAKLPPLPSGAVPIDGQAAATQPAPQEDLGHQIGDAVIEAPGVGALKMIGGLPGLPVDIMSGVGNFMRRNLGDGKSVPLSQSNMAGWGSADWLKWSQRHGIIPNNLPEATTEGQRIGQKAGGFLAGGALFGPTALAATPAAIVGSEVGRAADQVAPDLTRGYGEFAGGFAGPAAVPLARAAGRVMAASPMRAPANYRPSGVPTNADLRALAKEKFQAATDAGVIFNTAGLTRLAKQIRDTLASKSYLPLNQPRIGPVLDELNNRITSGANSTFDDLMALRQAASDAAENATGKEQFLSGKIVDHIDDFTDTVKPNETLAGNTAEARAAVLQARDAWHRVQKSTDVDLAIQKAANRASTGGSGANVENTMRQNLRRILDKLDERKIKNGRYRGWSDEEVGLLRRAVHGSNTQNLLRYLGKLSPEHTAALGAEVVLGAGGAMLNPAAAPVALGAMTTGFIAKHLSEGLENAKINKLSNTIRGGQQRPVNAGRGPTIPPTGGAIPPGPSGGPPAAPNGPSGQPPMMPPQGQLRGPRQAPPTTAPTLQDISSQVERYRPDMPTHTFSIQQNGSEIGRVLGTIKGDTFHIENAYVGDPMGYLTKNPKAANSLGPAMTRRLFMQLRGKLPRGVTKITGERVNGARGTDMTRATGRGPVASVAM